MSNHSCINSAFEEIEKKNKLRDGDGKPITCVEDGYAAWIIANAPDEKVRMANQIEFATAKFVYDNERKRNVRKHVKDSVKPQTYQLKPIEIKPRVSNTHRVLYTIYDDKSTDERLTKPQAFEAKNATTPNKVLPSNMKSDDSCSADIGSLVIKE